MNFEDVDSAFAEAGGVFPSFQNGEDMDLVEKNMAASGYTCERTT